MFGHHVSTTLPLEKDKQQFRGKAKRRKKAHGKCESEERRIPFRLRKDMGK